MTIYKPITLLSSSYKSYQFLLQTRWTKRYCPRCKNTVLCIPKHHFHIYLKEIEFRFNYKHQNLFLILIKLLTNLLQDRT